MLPAEASELGSLLTQTFVKTRQNYEAIKKNNEILINADIENN
jgi:hypothetical protein